ncbi:hypothetical protein DMN91_002939 [Ooceraea biroi]|uniref:60S ribosomal export protein NMD3 n=1 Tax=Ooceraea biroi TaxID=2015173 RepID=A0A026WBK0_OOCBI|nr:60S ribosomal export protein NMD3 [Ooceraea biroi]EZA53026.1 60S ribosomal export protein NMD3 [Ooceraea biroi]RLU24849.1 hypothetical protein DMN91_002939 [Ooceraea biroi]
MECVQIPDMVQDKAMVPCCECGTSIVPNPANMCIPCLRTRVDITEGIPKQVTLYFCNKCERYLQPPSEWVHAVLESKELLTLCLKRLKGLDRKGLRLINAGFVWTEPHSKRLKVQLNVQEDVIGGAVLQQIFVVEYTINNQMCTDCHRIEAKDYWNACVQIRQKATNKKTFLLLEQLVMKYKVHEQAVGMKPVNDGLDFFYANESAARKMVDFLVTVVPCRYQHSKKLISHDCHSNIYNYKFTYSVEIVPVSKDSVVCLPRKLTQQLGGISPICLVHKITNSVHLMDVSSGQVAEVSATVYWRYNFNSICNPKQLMEYIVMNIEIIRHENKNIFPGQGCISNKHVIADVWLVKASELGINNNEIHTRTHLGHILKPGDSVLGYALKDSNINDTNFDKLNDDTVPDVILVKKFYGHDKAARRRARLWKLKHIVDEVVSMNTENNEYNDFLDELEEDPEFRQNVNIFRDSSKIPVDTDEIDPTVPRITLAEMLDDLAIEDVEMGDS